MRLNRSAGSLLAYVPILLLAAAGTSAGHSKPTPEPAAKACERVVRSHVRATRGWPDDVYEVTPERDTGGLVGYAVMHRDDRMGSASDEYLSFHVDLDVKCAAVVRELFYQ